MPTATRPLATSFARLGRAVLASLDEPSDAWLLDRFLANRDAEAFAALVARHGPMILAVCRRVTGDRHHADDAFQAVFLVLVRRANAVRPRSALRGWLYGVAVRTAQTAKARAHKRSRRERPVPTLPDGPAPEPATSEPSDLQALDEEIAGLPERLRTAVVLCELDGLTRKDAAARLGVAEGTLSSRLAKARKVLAERLRARGVVPAAGLGALLGQSSFATAVPLSLATAAAGLASPGPIPGSVTQLMHGVQKAMLMDRLKVLVVGAVMGLGLVVAGVMASPGAGAPCPPPVWVVAPQVGPTPVAPVAPIVVAPPPPAAVPPPPQGAVVADPILDGHLAAWEKQQKGMVNVYTSFTLTRKDAIQKKEEKYRGSMLYMKPGFARMRMENVTDVSDYEAYISDGKSIWGYRSLEKMITDFRLTAPEPTTRPERWIWEFEKTLAQRMYSRISPTGDGALSMFGEVTAKGLRERYTVKLFKPDPNYVYIDMIPRRVTDSARIKQLRVALYGPNVKAPHTPYVPSQVFILRTNGDSEIWTFKESEWNVKRVDEQSFAFVPIPGWKVIKGTSGKQVPRPPWDEGDKP